MDSITNLNVRRCIGFHGGNCVLLSLYTSVWYYCWNPGCENRCSGRGYAYGVMGSKRDLLLPLVSIHELLILRARLAMLSKLSGKAYCARTINAQKQVEPGGAFSVRTHLCVVICTNMCICDVKYTCSSVWLVRRLRANRFSLLCGQFFGGDRPPRFSPQLREILIC